MILCGSFAKLFKLLPIALDAFISRTQHTNNNTLKKNLTSKWLP